MILMMKEMMKKKKQLNDDFEPQKMEINKGKSAFLVRGLLKGFDKYTALILIGCSLYKCSISSRARYSYRPIFTIT